MSKARTNLLAGLSSFACITSGMFAATGGDIVHGDGSINTEGNTTTINQLTDKMVINWDDFDIAADELVQFQQNSNSSVALNRVTAGGPTEIYGELTANGRIFILNSAGILFGKDASVDVGGLLATTLSIRDEDFLGDNFQFELDDTAALSYVVNKGKLEAREDGFIHLVAPGVQNSGLIVANVGDVVLASGDKYAVDFSGDGLVSFEVSGEVLSSVTGPDGESLEAAVSNTGTVQSKGGRVVMSGDAARDIMSSVVNNGGIVEATSLDGKGGSIEMTGRGAGQVVNTGTLDASGQTQGGNISMTGELVGQFGRASADAENGTAGKINLYASDTVALTDGSETTASALNEGQGGEILAIGEKGLLLGSDASVAAKGGAQGGDGGFIETSGYEGFQIGTTADVSAAAGNAGTWLIDPNDIEIVAGNGATRINAANPFASTADNAQLGVDLILTALNSGNVSITTQDQVGSGERGDITLSTDLLYGNSADRTLTLNAANDVIINNSIQATGGKLSVTLNANSGASASGSGMVEINGSITTNGGNFNATGIDFTSTTGGGIQTNGGSATIGNTGDVTLGGTLNAGAGQISVSNSANLAINSSLTSIGLVDLYSFGDITANADGSVTATTVNLTTQANGGVRGGSIGANGAAIKIAATGTVSATADDGDVYLQSTGPSLKLGNVYARNAGLVATEVGGTIANQNRTIDISAQGDVTLTGQVAASDVVTIDTTGAIIESTSGVDFVATTLNLSGTAIGTSGNALETSVGTLNATATTGGVFAKETDTLTTGDISAQGNVGLTTDSNGIALGGTTGIDSEGSVTLTSAGAITDANGNANNIDAKTVTLTAQQGIGAGDALELSNVSSKLKATADNGDIALSHTGDLTLGEVIAKDAGTVPLEIEGEIENPTHNVTIDSTGKVTLTAGVTASDTVTLHTAGEIVEDTAGVDFTATTLDLSASSIGTSENPLETFIANLNAVTTNGSLWVTEADRVRTGNISVTGGDFGLTTNLNGIQLGGSGIVSDGSVEITADTDITDDNGSATNIDAGTVVLDAGGHIGGADSLELANTTDLKATTDGEIGDIGITDTGSLTKLEAWTEDNAVSITHAGGAFNFDGTTKRLTLTSTGTPLESLIFENSAGNIEVAGLDLTGGDVSLGADGAITQSGTNAIIADSIEMAGTSLGAAGNAIRTDAAHLDATGTAGSVYLRNAQSLTLSAAAIGDGHDLEVVNSGDLTVELASGGNAVDLTANGGSILDGNPGMSSVVATAGAKLTATGGSIGTSSQSLGTAITGDLEASSSADGVYLQNAGSLDSASITATGGDIKLENTGNVGLGSLDADGNVTLDVLGDVTDAADDDSGTPSIDIKGQDLTVNATSFGADTDHKIETDVSGEARITTLNGGIYLKQLNAGQVLDLVTANAGGSGSDIEVTANGTINLGKITAQADRVVLISEDGQITDAHTTSGEAAVTAKELLLDAADGVTGSNGGDIILNVSVLSASGGSGDVAASNQGPVFLFSSTLSGKGNVSIAATDIIIVDSSVAANANNGALLSQSAGSVVTVGSGGLNLKATGGDIVFLNQNDTLATTGSGDINLTAQLGTDNLGVSSGGHIIAGNLKTAGGDIKLEADRDVTIGKLDAVYGGGDVSIIVPNGIIIDGNGTAENLIGNKVSIVVQKQDTVENTLRQTLAIADFSGKTSDVNTSNLVLTIENNNLAAETNQAAVAASNYQSKLSNYNSKNRTAVRENTTLSIYQTMSNTLATAVKVAQLAKNVIAIPSGGAQAIPLSGDGGAETGDAIAEVALGVADLALDSYDRYVLGPQATKAENASNALATAEAELTAATLDNQAAVSELNSARDDQQVAQESFNTALLMQAASAKLLQQSYAVLATDNPVGTSTQPLGVSASRVDVSTLGQLDTYVSLESKGANPLGLGDISTIGTSDIDVTALNDIIVKGQVGNSSTQDVRLTSSNGEIDGTANTTDDTVIAENLTLKAATGIGTDSSINTKVDNIAAQNTTGDVSVINTNTTNALTIADLNGVNGVSSDGDIDITTSGDLRLSHVIKDTNLATDHTITLVSGGSIIDTQGGDTTNLNAAGVALTADTGIASTDNFLEIEAQNLEATSATGGLYVVDNTGSLNLGSVNPTAGNALSGVSTTTSGDAIVIVKDGSLTTSEASNVIDDIRLESREAAEGTIANIGLNGSVTSQKGNVSLISTDSISQGVNGDVFTQEEGKTIDLKASDAISMVNGALTQSNNGVIRYEAGSGNITVGEIATGAAGTTTGKVGLFAGGNILDLAGDNATDITSQDLILQAGGSIGQGTNHLDTQVANLSAQATNGAAFITEADDLTVTNLTTQVNRVQVDGSLVPTTVDTQEDLSTAGDLVVSTGDGSLTVNGGTDASGVSAGDDLRLSAGETAEVTTADLTLNADVRAAGNISLQAADDVTQNADGDLSTTTDGKTIDVAADHAITMVDGALTQSVNGAIRYEATTGDITLGELKTGEAGTTTGKVGVFATNGSILDRADDTSAEDITAQDLILNAGTAIGESDNHLDTQVDVISTASGTGSTFVTEADSVTVDDLGMSINRVQLDGSLVNVSNGQEDLTSGADLVLNTVDGSITVNGGTDAAGIVATDDLLLNAGETDETTDADITLNATVTSTAGNVSIVSEDSITQNVHGDVFATAADKAIDLKADDAITMVDGALSQAANGNIRYEAGTGDITLGELQAFDTIGVFATDGSILDLATDTSTQDLTAQNLILDAGTAIGEPTNHLETQVDVISTASGTGSTFITEADGVTVDDLSMSVDRVQLDGSLVEVDDAQEDLTSGADLVLRTVDGSITVNGGADIAGIEAAEDILLVANESSEVTDADITLNASVTSTGGNISMRSYDDVTQNADGDIFAQGEGKSIYVGAYDNIAMVDDALTQSTNGTIVYSAYMGNVTLGELKTGEAGTTTGQVWVEAGNDILDLAVDSSVRDITAHDLVLDAGRGIGEPTNHIDTQVEVISTASGTGSTFITEADDITVDALSMSINGVQTDGTTQVQSDDQEDLSSGADLVLQTLDGSITVNGGSDDAGILATDDILLSAGETDEATTANVKADATITSTDGNVSLIAKDSVEQTAKGDVFTQTDGQTIDVKAADAITMQDGALTQSVNGAIRYEATTGDITLGELKTGDAGLTTGKVGVFATAGSILDRADDTSAQDITARDLILNAGTDIGQGNDHLDTQVEVVTTDSGTGSTFIDEADALTVNDLSMSIDRVQSDGSLVNVDNTQEDLTAGTDIVVRTLDGSLVVNGGTDDAGIEAGEDILLESGESVEATNANQTLNATVTSTGGNISLVTQDSITQNVHGDIFNQHDGGSIDLKADHAISMVDGALTQSTNGEIRYEATTGDITLGELKTGDAGTTTGKVGVFATAGDILDLALDSSAQDITAHDLILSAGSDIAQATNHLETQVDVISTDSGTGSTFITEADSVTVDDLSMSVDRVQRDGSVEAVANAQEDLTSGADLVLQTVDGSITVNGGTDDEGVVATDDILLSAGETAEGTISNVKTDATVTSTAGNVSMIAKDSVEQTATGDVFTQTDGKTIDVKADDAITMQDGALTQSVNGAIRYEATTGDITLGELKTGDANVTTGKVGVFATAGSILDRADDTSVQDITAHDLILNAGTAIGEGDNHLDTQVEIITTASGTGSTFVTEADDVTVDDLSMTIDRVQADGSLVTTAPDVQEDLRSGADLVLQTSEGNLVVNGGTDSTGVVATDDILLRAGESTEVTGADLTVNATVTSTDGNATLLADDSITQNVDGDVYTLADGKTIDVQASDAISMVNGALTESNNGAIRYEATTGDITLGELKTGDAGTTTGKVGVFATQGSILDLAVDSSAQDITAEDLILSAGSDIAQATNHLETQVEVISTHSGTGSTFITEADSVTVDDLSMSVDRVNTDGTTRVISNTQEDLSSGADLVLNTVDGSITVNGGTDDAGVVATDDILLNAGETAEITDADLTVNATVTSTAGNVSVISQDSIEQTATGDVFTQTDGKTIDVKADDAITMQDGALTQSTNGAIRYEATTGDITLGELKTGDAGVTTGKVGVFATNGSILDRADDTSAEDITAQDLILSAGTAIGEPTNHLDTQVVVISTHSGTGSTFITEADGVTVDDLSMSIDRVQLDGGLVNVANGQEDLTSGADLVLNTVDGSITVNGGTDAAGIVATDDILLNAGETDEVTDADITLNATVTSTAGNISIVSDDSITQNVDGDVFAEADGKTIDVKADDAIRMVDGALTQSTNGAIRYEATTGDITLGELKTGDANVTTGKVGVFATNGSILDRADDTSAEDITAHDLILSAGTAIGQANNHLDTQVEVVTTDSGTGSTFITEADGVTVDDLSMSIDRVQLDGSVEAVSNTQEDLTSGADLVLNTVDGSITVNGGTDAAGIVATDDILLNAGETDEVTDADITLNATVTSTAGNISIISKDSITQNVDGDVFAEADGKTIDVKADDAITMVDGALTQSTNGAIRYEATTGDITLGELKTGDANVTTGKVGVFATQGSILDRADDTSAEDITAQDLILSAGTAIGEPTNHLDTQVEVISTHSGTGSTFITEADGVTVDDLSMSIDRVQLDGSVEAVSNTQEDLTSGADLVLNTVNGSLYVNGGTDNTGVVATDDILLNAGETAEATNANLTVNATVTSTDGNVSIASNDSIEQTSTGDVFTEAEGKTIDVKADDAITMNNGALTQSTNGAIRYEATTGDITLGELKTGDANVTTGKVGVFATEGSILDLAADSSAQDITAHDLILSAGTAIGQANNHVDTQVEVISTHSGTGSTFVTEADSVTVDDLSMTVDRVQLDGSLVTTAADVQEDLTSGADLVLSTVNGSLYVNGGTDNAGVVATDDILLNAGETTEATNANLTVNATVTSTDGNVSIASNDSITQTSTGDVFTEAEGKTIDVKADDAITMNNGALTESTNGAIRYEATTGDITVGELKTGDAGTTTGKVGVFATEGSILDLAVDSSTQDITAQDLILNAGTAIAEANNHLETQVEVVTTGSGTGSTFITEADSVTVDDLSMTVDRVQQDGSLEAVANTQEDLTSGADLVLNTVDGSLTVDGGTDDRGVVATDDILLSAGELAEGTSADLKVNAAVTSTSGNVSLTSVDSIEQTATGDVSTETDGKTIDVLAQQGDIVMADGAVTESVDGAIRYEARDGDITLGQIRTGDAGTTTGKVALIANDGSVLDRADDTSVVDVVAGGLIVQAGDQIGTETNSVETNVDTLAAAAGTNAYLTELDGVTVDDLSLTVDRVNTDGSVTTTTADALEDLTAGNDLVLRVSAGDLTVNGGTDTAGIYAGNNLKLDVDQGDLTLNGTSEVLGDALVNADRGDLTVNAAIDTTGDATLNATQGNLTTNAVVTTGGNAELNAAAGDLTVNDDVVTTGNLEVNADLGDIVTNGQLTTEGNARVNAGAGNLTVNGDVDTTGNLEVNAGQGDLLVEGDVVTGGNTLVTAGEGTLTTNGTIDTTGNAEINAGLGNVAVNGDVTTGGDLNVLAGAGNLTVNGNVDTEGETLVKADAGDVTTTGRMLSQGNLEINALKGDVRVAGPYQSSEQDLKVLAGEGDITIDGDMFAVGQLTLKADAGDITTNAEIGSYGLALLEAEGNLTTNGQVNSGGDIQMRTHSGDLTVNAAVSTDFATHLSSDTGNIVTNASVYGSAGLDLSAGTGDITLNATAGSGQTDINVTAGGNITQTAAGDIHASAAGKAINVTAGGDITMADGATAMTDNGVIDYSAGGNVVLGGLDAGTSNVNVTATAGAITDGGDTDLEVVASELNLTAGAGVAPDSNALETSLDRLSANVANGNLSVNEADALTLDGITMGSGDLNVSVADGSITLGTVTTDGDATLTAAAGSIFDDNVNSTLLTADTANLVARDGIGTEGALETRAIDTQVNTLNATVTGAGEIYINEVDGMTVGAVETLDGDINLVTQSGDMTVDAITAGGEDDTVTLVAETGSVLGGAEGANVNATNLAVSAGNGVGNDTNVLDLNVDNFVADGGNGGVHVSSQNPDGLNIGGVTPGMGLEDIEGVSTDGGDISIQADTQVTVAETIRNENGGNIRLDTDGDIQQDTDILGSGEVILNAGGSITMANDTTTSNTDGDIVLRAGNEVELSSVVGTIDSTITIISPTLSTQEGAHLYAGEVDVYSVIDPIELLEVFDDQIPIIRHNDRIIGGVVVQNAVFNAEAVAFQDSETQFASSEPAYSTVASNFLNAGLWEINAFQFDADSGYWTLSFGDVE